MTRQIVITRKWWLPTFSILMFVTLVRESSAQIPTPPPGGVRALNPADVGPKSTTGVVTAPFSPNLSNTALPSPPNNTANAELNAYRQVREEALVAIEKVIKDKYPNSKTAKERVAEKLAGTTSPNTKVVGPTPLDTSGLPKELKTFADAASKLVELRNKISTGGNDLPDDAAIKNAVTNFDIALTAVKFLKNEEPHLLAANLLKIAIKSIDDKTLEGLPPGNSLLPALLPALLRNFVGQLGLDAILSNANPQGQPSESEKAFTEALTEKSLFDSYQELTN